MKYCPYAAQEWQMRLLDDSRDKVLDGGQRDDGDFRTQRYEPDIAPFRPSPTVRTKVGHLEYVFLAVLTFD